MHCLATSLNTVHTAYGAVCRRTHTRRRRTSTRVNVRRRTAPWVAVDANYMLRTVVVNGHSCVAVRRRTPTNGKGKGKGKRGFV